MTGRAAGFCAGFSTPGFANSGRGGGRGCGMGQGRRGGMGAGFGRGWLNAAYSESVRPALGQQEELLLRKKQLEAELRVVSEQLGSMKETEE
jgi:hypothetical protein